MKNKTFLLCAVLSAMLVTPVFASENIAPSTPTSTKLTVKSVAYENAKKKIGPLTAKQYLVDGNKRFTSGKFATKDLSSQRIKELLKGQHPFAVIVSCSDSRVPPELLFDQALGDVFVVRVAGNVVDKLGIGSVEYAVEHLHAPLVVVMGHEKCGAVKATIDGGEAPGSIGAIVEKIKSVVNKLKAKGVKGAALAEQSENQNVIAVRNILQKSPVLKHAVKEGELRILGAKYHLGTGTVEWLK